MMRRWSTMDPRDISKVAAEPSIPPERLLRLTEVVQYRLVIADDHPLFRGALREAVEGLLEQVDIAEAGTFDELVELLERDSEVDLVLLHDPAGEKAGIIFCEFLRRERLDFFKQRLIDAA